MEIFVYILIYILVFIAASVVFVLIGRWAFRVNEQIALLQAISRKLDKVADVIRDTDPMLTPPANTKTKN